MVTENEINLLEALEISREENRLLRAQLAQQSGWVRCGDRMPSQRGRYLIYGSFEPQIGYFLPSEGRFISSGRCPIDAIFWYEIPEDPML